MNWLDVVIIVTMVISFIGGFFTGLVRGLLSLVGMLAGIVLAGRFYPSVAGRLTFIHSENTANIVAFAIILAAVMIVFGIIATILHNALSAISLGCLDHFVGAVLGIIINALTWAALLALWARFFGSAAVANSLIAGFLLDKFPVVLSLLPPDFQSVRDFFK
jgi:membrane protein required for colicin V production